MTLRKFAQIAAIMMIAGTPLALTACDKEGPAERAGEKIDDAAEKAADKIENATDKAAEKMEEAKDKAAEKIDEATEHKN
jgi:hyperosmotically inducible protein